MRRERGKPRPGWEQTVASQGMCYGTCGPDGGRERPSVLG